MLSLPEADVSELTGIGKLAWIALPIKSRDGSGSLCGMRLNLSQTLKKLCLGSGGSIAGAISFTCLRDHHSWRGHAWKPLLGLFFAMVCLGAFRWLLRYRAPALQSFKSIHQGDLLTVRYDAKQTEFQSKYKRCWLIWLALMATIFIGALMILLWIRDARH
jgi:ABC-type enterochelin transport system permease subunit